MRRFPGCACLLLALLSLFAVPASSAMSLDRKLLSLVPEGSQIVAGMDSPPPKGQPGSFVLITHNNTVDLQDSLALMGADSSRIVRHVIFVAIDEDTGHLNEHGLLMSGQFDRERIYKSALEGGAVATDYRGIPVLMIQPFERERADFHDVRWLAVVGSDVLLFGTINSVRQELDRHLSTASADPSLVHKLSRMHSDDETWCVLSAPARNPEIQTTLTALDSRLADLAGSADAFQFGIRYRKQVEFEYEATTSSASRSNSLRQSLTGPKMGSSLLPPQNAAQREMTIRGVVKIPVEQFGAWLSKTSAHGAPAKAAP